MEITSDVLPGELDWFTSPVELRDGWLEFPALSSSPAGTYADPETILGAFLRLSDPAGVAVFAERYGPLGWETEAVDADSQSPQGVARERLEAWFDQVNRLVTVVGIYVGLHRFAEGAPDGISLVREMLGIAKEYGELRHQRVSADDDQLITDAEIFISGWTRARFARMEFWLVPARLAGGERGRFTFAMAPNTLMDVIDLQLAQSFARQSEMRYCANSNCNRPFVVRDKRMVFCSSTCAHRAHARRSMAKLRAEQRSATT